MVLRSWRKLGELVPTLSIQRHIINAENRIERQRTA